MAQEPVAGRDAGGPRQKDQTLLRMQLSIYEDVKHIRGSALFGNRSRNKKKKKKPPQRTWNGGFVGQQTPLAAQQRHLTDADPAERRIVDLHCEEIKSKQLPNFTGFRQMS